MPWCAVRPWAGEFATHKVDEERMVARDPSVALLDSGEDLRIFYAYESLGGVLLATSDGEPAAYGGVVSLTAGSAAGAGEIKRMWVHEDWRGAAGRTVG